MERCVLLKIVYRAKISTRKLKWSLWDFVQILSTFYILVYKRINIFSRASDAKNFKTRSSITQCITKRSSVTFSFKSQSKFWNECQMINEKTYFVSEYTFKSIVKAIEANTPIVIAKTARPKESHRSPESFKIKYYY